MGKGGEGGAEKSMTRKIQVELWHCENSLDQSCDRHPRLTTFRIHQIHWSSSSLKVPPSSLPPLAMLSHWEGLCELAHLHPCAF